MQIGFKLIAEAFSPKDIVRQAVRAEQVGFDFVEMSDHFHPWLDVQGHSPFAWSTLGAIAERTDRIGLATGVTCPIIRYHPAIIAQAAATTAILSDGRFTLGIGAGERLNEHIVDEGFPPTPIRHHMLREALEIIRLLWQGGYRSYYGEYLSLADARVWDLPETPPVIAVAAGGHRAAEIAAELGGAMFAVEPDPALVRAYQDAGGDGPRYLEIGVAYADTPEAGAEAALRTNRFALGGWKVMSELPNPANFAAASTTVRASDMRAAMVCGNDPSDYVDVVRTARDAGYDRIALMNVGPNMDAFFDFYQSELDGALRKLA
ncbi:TIGR03557 family F420-dependent LLM class oxidoreductase [Nocardia camponoti]|uniref:LLM class F420-dependent oxidoreductase n=1 Tax=Nocardia camponoti TaxID=1616106 RepID=A0A917QC21_9NOCA|nr:TIGR03557 family F420-dependent LLM class oxidoreductase [Nocardia camponoti]GGK42020.1 LLM class F420-dependent oxidoreductase [Nocardia camponoti]